MLIRPLEFGLRQCRVRPSSGHFRCVHFPFTSPFAGTHASQRERPDSSLGQPRSCRANITTRKSEPKGEEKGNRIGRKRETCHKHVESKGGRRERHSEAAMLSALRLSSPRLQEREEKRMDLLGHQVMLHAYLAALSQ